MKVVKRVGISGNSKQRRKAVRKFNKRNKPLGLMRLCRTFGIGTYIIYQQEIELG